MPEVTPIILTMLNGAALALVIVAFACIVGGLVGMCIELCLMNARVSEIKERNQRP